MRAQPAFLVLPLVLVLLIPSPGVAQQPRGRPTVFPQGWSEAERRDFYHMSLGGEIFPLTWARALESVRTRRPFLEGLDRFGFIEDPRDRDHLPIGLTAAARKPGASARMLGINCGLPCE